MRSKTCPFLGTAGVLVAAVLAAGPSAFALEVRATQNTSRLMPYQIFELTLQHEGVYHDPNWDVSVDVTLEGPGGQQHRVGGFFYGSSQPQKPIVRRWKDDKGQERSEARWPCEPADLWKARYAPSQLGRWQYRYVFTNKQGEKAEGKGAFDVVPPRRPSKGWVRIDPHNPLRFVFADGSPFYPIGLQDGVFDGNHNGSAMDAKSMEGPFRQDRAGARFDPPPGAIFARGPSMNPQNGDVYFGRYSRAGFNVWRFSPHNFSIPVFDVAYHSEQSSPGQIRWQEARMVDEMLLLTRKYGIRNFYGVFGFAKVFNDHPEDARSMAKVKQILKYSVDRWGAMVDFWELLNEQKASDAWYAAMIPYLKSIDPYHKPIATSWERPELEGIDVDAPHWYAREDELASDQVTAHQAGRHVRFGKPVVFGEQGNGGGKPELVREGIGGVWDPGSARRIRVRLWSAMFHEVSFIFWATNYAKDGHSMNIWLGPEERQYVRALADFSDRLGRGVRPVEVHLEGAKTPGVRGYALRSDRRVGIYLHHGDCAECRAGAKPHRWDHRRGLVQGLSAVFQSPRSAKGYWYSPADARILGTTDVVAGENRLAAPDFEIDLALLVTEEGPPDIDRDGLPNDADPDDDNDGRPDAQDAFPLEREEQDDADADRIGDTLDADIGGDGKADDRNGNGVVDNEEKDLDGDGVATADATPWDAFPRDPKEWRDTDGDGVGDNADPDDDGDGFSDAEEQQAGTDPLDAVSFPAAK